MVDQARGQVLMDSNAIAEYFEETVEGKAMINGTAANRAEIRRLRSEEHTSELQSLMRISYAVFCLKKKKHLTRRTKSRHQHNIILPQDTAKSVRYTE